MINPGYGSGPAPTDLHFISGTVPSVCQNIVLNRGTWGNSEMITYFPELHNLRNTALNL